MKNYVTWTSVVSLFASPIYESFLLSAKEYYYLLKNF